MDRLNKAIACMNELGRKIKVNSFEDKLVLQKTICLLELMGVRIGYSFSLYIRGPYSPDLTEDIYHHREMVESSKTGYALSKHEKELVGKVSEASNNLEPEMLEIMATYAYFIKNGRDSREAFLETKKLKPFFSESKIVVSVSRAKQLFPPSEEAIRRMKAEFSDWENTALSGQKY